MSGGGGKTCLKVLSKGADEREKRTSTYKHRGTAMCIYERVQYSEICVDPEDVASRSS